MRTCSFILLAFFSTLMLRAHESRPAYLEFTEIDTETVEVLWKVPARGADERLSLNPRWPEGTTYAVPPSASIIGAAYVERSTLRRSGGFDDQEIYIEGLSRTLTDALFRFQRLSGATQTSRLSPDAPSVVIEAEPSRFQVSWTYTVLGVQHILEGVDHLLFVGCLLLVAGMGRKLVITITGFTLAHSVTLALATLDIVRIPVPPVEAVIALSIVFLAREIARPGRDSLTYRYPVAVSMSFGLLHGFGFAAVLGEIGLPASDVPIALLCFNVGVELGQLLFIGILLLPVLVWRRLRPRPQEEETSPSAKPGRTWRAVEILSAYAIGTVAAWWTLERVWSFWA
jgi:hydrogenase/urease accessory protein HupE